jgi:hypothetical protein
MFYRLLLLILDIDAILFLFFCNFNGTQILISRFCPECFGGRLTLFWLGYCYLLNTEIVRYLDNLLGFELDLSVDLANRCLNRCCDLLIIYL